jgi:predicted alpha/beta hydrolase
VLLQRAEDAAAPVVLGMPAMGVDAGYYRKLLDAFSEYGVHAAVTDLRGKGECSVRPRRGIDFGYHEMITYDISAAVARVRQVFPNNRVYLLGHSLGGQLSALYMSVRPRTVDGLVLIASGSNDFRQWPWPQRLPVLAGTQLASLIAGACGYFPGKPLRFAGTEARTVIQDWARQARTGRYEPTHAAHDFEQTLRTVDAPVLAISLANDNLAPQAAVDHLCSKMPRAQVERWHYAPREDPRTNADHFRWAKRPDAIVARVGIWLTTKGALAAR